MKQSIIVPKRVTYSTSTERYLGGGDQLKLTLTIEVDSAHWAAKHRVSGTNAILDFKINVENEFYSRSGVGVIHPTVSTSERASRGVKKIRFTYPISLADLKKLGGEGRFVADREEYGIDSWNLVHARGSMNDLGVDRSKVIEVDFVNRRRVA